MTPHRPSSALALLAALAICAFPGCGRDTRVNSDPGPGRPSQATGGENSVKLSPAEAQPKATTSQPGTDSTGRPADSSGGTVGGAAGAGTTGTQTGNQAEERKNAPK